ncbi:MAG: hypothetical protein IPK53_12245 [bacterium]|nr:hypothetical protein [bacterium]
MNVTNPAAPFGSGFFDTPGYAVGVAVSGSYAYVADDIGGLRVVDITNPAAPFSTGNYTPGSVDGISVSGNLAYVSFGRGGIRAVDISNPAAPGVVGSYAVTQGSEAFGKAAVSGNYGYVLEYGGIDGLRVVDVTNPASPVSAGFYVTPYEPSDIAVSGNFAYVVCGWTGLRVVDISNPAVPFETGFYDDPPGDPTPAPIGVAVSGNYAYLAESGTYGGLRVVDVSNPSAPVSAGMAEWESDARRVAVSGNFAYVTDIYGGLYIVNVADPAAPFIAGHYNAPDFPRNVAVSGNFAYVANHDVGLLVVNVTNPAAPFLAGSYNTPGFARDVAVSGCVAYIADATNFGTYGISYFQPCAAVARCCYSNSNVCADTTEAACTSLSGQWTANETCASGPCVASPPRELVITQSGSDIILTWFAPAGGWNGQYQIFRSSAQDAIDLPGNLIATVGTTSYTDLGILDLAGETNFYVIRCVP